MGAAGDDDAQARSDGGWRMNRIDELIAQLCPEGVEFQALGEFGELVRGNGMPKSDFVQSGVGCIHYGQIYTYYGIWTTETISFVAAEKATRLAKVEPGDLIITNTSENVDDVCKAVAWIGDTQIVTGGHATVLKHDQDPKYLSYYLQTPPFLAEKRKYATGTKVIDVSAKSLAKIRIPIPPLEIQREIVKVLDAFSALEAELEAELEARRQQYAHYRDRLLSYEQLRMENGEWRIGAAGDEVAQARRGDVRWATLGEVGAFVRGSGIQKSDFTESGVGCIHYGQIHTYYGTWATQTKSFVSKEHAARLRKANPGNLVITTTSEDDEAVAKAVAWIGAEDVAVSTDAYIFRHSLNPKYVAYFFQTDLFQSQKKPHITGTKVRRISGEGLAKIRIPVPSLAEQARIVAILDQFDALVNDLSRGLPAEITARRQQYAHYRDRLLTFGEWRMES
jgi:type I restriction enzyme S subunit